MIKININNFIHKCYKNIAQKYIYVIKRLSIWGYSNQEDTILKPIIVF